MGLLSFLKRKKLKKSEEEGWFFSVPREDLEKMVRWDESSEPRKEPNSVEFMAIDEDGKPRYVVMRTKNPYAPPILDLVHGYALRYCEESNLFFMGIQAYGKDGNPVGSISSKFNIPPPPGWLIGYEEYDILQKIYEEEERREERFLNAHKKYLATLSK